MTLRVMVRVPITPGMSTRDVIISAIQVYMDCSYGQATEFFRELGSNVSRDLRDDEQRAASVRVMLVLPEDWVHRQRARTRHELDALTPAQRAFIFQGGASAAELTDDNIDDYTRIVDLTQQLSANEQEAFLSRVSTTTENPETFAQSLESFAAHQRERTGARETTLEAEAEIFGVYEATAPIFERMQAIPLQDREVQPDPSFQPTEEHRALQLQMNELREEYLAVLARFGFDSEEEFGAAVASYREAYQGEAVLIAQEALSATGHQVFLAEAQIEDEELLGAMFQSLGPARGAMAAANQVQVDRGILMERGGGTSITMPASAQAAMDAQKTRARGLVRGLADLYPALGFGPDPWIDAIAFARSPAELREVLDGHCTEMRESIVTMRTTLDEDPEVIWLMDSLIDQVNTETGLDPGSGPGRAVMRTREEHESDQTAADLALGGVAVVAGLLTMGEGTVAVLGGAAALGIGSYQTMEEFRRYEVNNAANNTGMLSNDPSIAWAVISLMGVGLDAAGILAIFRQAPAVTEAMRAVGTSAGEEAVEGLTVAMRSANAPELTVQAQQAVLVAARARAAENAAFDVLRSQINNGDHLVLTAARQDQVTAEITHSVHSAMQGGLDGLERWVRTPQARSLVGSVNEMTPEEMAVLRDAYLSARHRANQFQTRATALGLSETQTSNALAAWARAPASSGDDVLAEMQSFALGGQGLDAPTASAPPSRTAAPHTASVGDATGSGNAIDPNIFDDGPGVLPRRDPMADEIDRAIQEADIEDGIARAPQADDARRYEMARNGIIPDDAPPGTVARVRGNNEAEALRLFYAARENSPLLETGVIYNRETGNWLILRGTESSLPWPSRDELVRVFGEDHPMIVGNRWDPDNWDVPIHVHPQQPVTGVTGPNGTVPSMADFEVARDSATISGEAVGGHAQFTTSEGINRTFFSYDPSTQLYTFRGRVPTATDPSIYEDLTLIFETPQQYADYIYPRVGASMEPSSIPFDQIPPQ